MSFYPHLAVVQQRSETLTLAGEQVDSWSTFINLHVNITPLSGREMATAKEMHADISHRMDSNYTAGITTAMRILRSGRVFNILSVINVGERNKTLEIFCREVVA